MLVWPRAVGMTPEANRAALASKLSPQLDRGSRALKLTRTSRARPAANALHEIHFRRVGRDVEPLIAGLAENVPADTDARFIVKTIGIAIRALFGVERAHNAHVVRMVLRDIIDHSGNNAQNVVQFWQRTPQQAKAKQDVVSG